MQKLALSDMCEASNEVFTSICGPVVPRSRSVPYFSQWETPDLVGAVLNGQVTWSGDPSWEMSGAASAEEYARWANDICGMACLKMIIAARTGRIVPTLVLAHGAQSFGAYVIGDDGAIKGMIYAPFVEYIRQSFDVCAVVRTGLIDGDMEQIMQTADFFIASVHHSICRPDSVPPRRGGHLVLVTRADDGHVVFNDPAGHTSHTRQGVRLTLGDFGRFFAGRGIEIRPAAAR